MNPAYRNLAPQQLTAAQQQQLLLQQGLNPSQVRGCSTALSKQLETCIVLFFLQLLLLLFLHIGPPHFATPASSDLLTDLSSPQLNSPQFQQLLRAGLIGGQTGVAGLQSAVNMASLMRPQTGQAQAGR